MMPLPLALLLYLHVLLLGAGTARKFPSAAHADAVLSAHDIRATCAAVRTAHAAGTRAPPHSESFDR